MNISKKHKKIDYNKLITANTGIPCSHKFIRWIQRNNLSIDEIRYLVNDGWTVYGNTVKQILNRSYGCTIK